MAYIPRLVVSLHGIRTHAEWQHTISECLSDRGIPVRHFRYGYFGLPRFLSEGSRAAMIDRFAAWLTRLAEEFKLGDAPEERPSIIAHSFGSYIAAYALLKHRELKADKLIICGSILPRDFDWSVLFGRDQLEVVRNEFGLRDVWSRLADWVVPGTGPSGRLGFLDGSAKVQNELHELHRHSDYFLPFHITNSWLPFLTTPPSRLAIRHGSEITSPDVFEKVLSQIRTIDDACYRELPHYRDVETAPYHSRAWRAANADIYVFLMDRETDDVVGYINAMPISTVFADALVRGELVDNEIPEDAVREYRRGEAVDLYVMSVAVSRRVRKFNEGLFAEPVERLIGALFEKLIRFAYTRGARVRRIIAVGWTRSGIRLAEDIFRMTATGRDRYGNPTYVLAMEDHASIAEAHHSLKHLARAYRDLGFIS